MDTPIGRFVAAELKMRGMSQQDLVRITGINKNTISDLVSGKTVSPSAKVLRAVEQALELTPGTLVGYGEDEPSAPKADESALRKATARQLVAHLAEQVENMNTLLSEWERPAKRYERRVSELFDFMAERERSASGELAELIRRRYEFDGLEAMRDLRPAEEAELYELDARLALRMFEESRASHSPSGRRRIYSLPQMDAADHPKRDRGPDGR